MLLKDIKPGWYVAKYRSSSDTTGFVEVTDHFGVLHGWYIPIGMRLNINSKGWEIQQEDAERFIYRVPKLALLLYTSKESR